MARLVEIEKGAGLRALGEKLGDLRPVLEQAGAYLTSRSQAAFREQGRGADRWPARMNPNVPGIVSDLNRGAAVPSRRFEGRPALTDTGRLRQSITWRVRGRREVLVGTTLPYAQTHQQGLPSEVALTSAGKRNLYEFLRERRDLGPVLGWLFNRPRFMVQVRPRPFLAVLDEDLEVIQELLDEHLEAA